MRHTKQILAAPKYTPEEQQNKDSVAVLLKQIEQAVRGATGLIMNAGSLRKHSQGYHEKIEITFTAKTVECIELLLFFEYTNKSVAVGVEPEVGPLAEWFTKNITKVVKSNNWDVE